MSDYELIAAAKKLYRPYRAGRPLTDPAFGEAAKNLLRVAVNWREAARARSLAAGRPDKPRPRFANPPALLDAPTDWHTFRRHLSWWASRYAWDKADGLPTKESARGLIRTALMGPARQTPSEAPSKPPKAA